MWQPVVELVGEKKRNNGTRSSRVSLLIIVLVSFVFNMKHSCMIK